MPDGIIAITIDVGPIREAQRRVELKRMLQNTESISSVMDSLGKAIEDTIDALLRLRDMSLDKEDQDAT